MKGCGRAAHAGVLAAAALAFAPVRAQAQTSSQPSAYEELQTLSGVLNYVRLNYADSVGYHALVRAAIDGVLRSLDPHSTFLTSEQAGRLAALERRELADAGVVVALVAGEATVLAPLPDGVAERAGVLAGDRIASIDDTVTEGLSAREVELHLIGPRGSRVRLVLLRGDRFRPDTVRVALKRSEPSTRSVSVARALDWQTAYVRLSQFNANAASEVREALRRQRGEGCTRAILDLRANPGGLIDEAVDVASLFLTRGTLVARTQGRRKAADAQYTARGGDEFRDLSLVLLIDEGTASASEIVAGALQDHDRALVAGRRSFGKALVMTALPLPSGDAVWLTIARATTPSGRFIQRRYEGLTPEQYRALAGRAPIGSDSGVVYHTDRGRTVLGGGGIAPDVALPAPTALPAWWGMAADTGLDAAVADSVAATLPADSAARIAWLHGEPQWKARLLQPFQARVAATLHVDASLSGPAEARVLRRLAARVALVRWGRPALEQFVLATDDDIAAALRLMHP